MKVSLIGDSNFLDMDKILVVAATKNEINGLFSNIPLPPIKMGEDITIVFKGIPIVLLVCGIGPINAAIFTERAILKNSIKGIVNIGIAGAFDLNKRPIGTLCLVSKEIWPEYGLKTQKGIDPKGLDYGLYKFEDGNIIFNEIYIPVKKNIDKMGLSFMDIFYTSASLTVAGVTGTKAEAQNLYNQYGADIENMEGFSIAYVAMLHNIPFIEIRAISNLVGSRDTKYWDIKKAINSLKDLQGIFE